MIHLLSVIAERILFISILLLTGLAIGENILLMLNWTFYWLPYTPGRLLEFAAILTLFLIAIICWQIREEMRQSNTHSRS